MQVIAGAAKGQGFPGASVFSAALGEAHTRMAELFDGMQTAVQNWRADVFSDGGKLKRTGTHLKGDRVAVDVGPRAQSLRQPRDPRPAQAVRPP
jgi:hypothetical protein